MSGTDELFPISLTPEEQELFTYLESVKTYANATSSSSVGDLRVCGGWVRDKLLGRASHDIDIAVEAMTGRDFVDFVSKLESDHGCKLKSVGVMKANTSKSKHVEVVTIRVGDMKAGLDIVNLRAALFSKDDGSAEAFGTPAQDAHCRDFTINSLFFNLSTRQVEDLTHQGLSDLRARVLRTPIDPHETLRDGPMCMLRAVRFAAHLDLQLHESLRAAIHQREIQDALAARVSRERVGRELLKILSGTPAQSACAVRLLHELSLWKALLLPQTELLVIRQDDGVTADYINNREHEVWYLSFAYALQMAALVLGNTTSATGDNHMKLRLLAAIVLPFAGHRVVRRDVAVPVFMLRESLKLKKQDVKDVDGLILKHLQAMQTLVHAASFDRIKVALLLRELKELWPVCMDLALVKELVTCRDSPVEADSGARAVVKALYSTFANNITENELSRVWELQPLVSGNELVTKLGVKPGMAIRQLLEKIIVWQIESPQMTCIECVERIQATLAEA